MNRKKTTQRACFTVASTSSAALVFALFGASCGAASQEDAAAISAHRAAVASSSAARGTMRIEVSNLGPTTGSVLLAVYDNAGSFPKKGGDLVAVKAAASQDPTVLEVPNLVDGRYAIAAFHDVNGNGKLDTSIIGYPTEPFGFSNNAKPAMFGPPSFEACAFDFRGPAMTVRMALIK